MSSLANVFKPDLFAGKRALITGGGSGIGLMIARHFILLGGSVIIAGRKESKLEAAGLELAGLLPADSGAKSVHQMPVNIRLEESVGDAVAKLPAELTVDYLINNAGGQFPSRAEDIKAKGFTAVVETNLLGTFLMTQALFQRDFKKRGGAIVNILMDNRNGFPMMAHSGAARAGVDNMTKTLASEWGRYGLRINSISPGVIRSSGLDTYAPEFQAKVEQAKQYNQAFRLGTETEVAQAVLFLLSPAAVYITGQNLYVDGGESLYTPLAPPVENDKYPPFG